MKRQRNSLFRLPILAALWFSVSTSLAFASNAWKLVAECNHNDARACDKLRSIALSPSEREANRVAAIETLRDRQALEQIASSDANAVVKYAANKKLQEFVNADFLHAVEAGDVKEMKALVAKGAQVRPGASVVDLVVEDLQSVNGGFRFRLKCGHNGIAIAASPAVLTAIRSGRVEVVRALIDLGADVKSEFVAVEADVPSGPVDEAIVENAVCLGHALTVAPLFSLDERGVVISTVRPTVQIKTTYLILAEQLLERSQEEDKRQALKQIVDLLQGSSQPPATDHAPSQGRLWHSGNEQQK
jgi:hypothetical protein